MIASATEGNRATNSGQTSVTVKTSGSDHSEPAKKSDDGENSNESGDGHTYKPARNPNISTSIPAIAFTKDIVATGGRLHAAVLINAAEKPGTATLVRDGVATSCSVQAQPGVVAWLDCSLNTSVRGGDDSNKSDKKSGSDKSKTQTVSTYQVVVKTVDGQTASHAVTIG
jgi:hypothetical protein